MSVRTVALNANRLARTTTVEGGTSALTISQTSFSAPLVAPDSEFSNLIQTSGGVGLEQELIEANLDEDGTADFTIRVSAEQASAPVWTDPVSGDASGYALFASNALTQDQQFAQNPFLQLIGTVEPITVSDGWPVEAEDEITFSFASADLNVAQRKLWYVAGDVVKMSLVSISEKGQLIHLNSVKATVTGT